MFSLIPTGATGASDGETHSQRGESHAQNAPERSAEGQASTEGRPQGLRQEPSQAVHLMSEAEFLAELAERAREDGRVDAYWHWSLMARAANEW
jgi:hypothetical protein